MAKPITAAMITKAGVDTSKYDGIVIPAAHLFNVPVAWVKAVIGKESTFRESPPHVAGDGYGLMQVTERTARALGFTGEVPKGLIDPMNNIYFGTMVLGRERSQHGNDFRAVYSAYNSGSAEKYKTSKEVAANVNGAVAWLNYFQGVAA